MASNNKVDMAVDTSDLVSEMSNDNHSDNHSEYEKERKISVKNKTENLTEEERLERQKIFLELVKTNTEKAKAEIKNPVFLKNCTDSRNGCIVNKIWMHSLTKLNRDKWDLVWEYYSDRKRNSVDDCLKTWHNRLLKIIYKGDPRQHILDMRAKDESGQVIDVYSKQNKFTKKVKTVDPEEEKVRISQKIERLNKKIEKAHDKYEKFGGKDKSKYMVNQLKKAKEQEQKLKINN
jgi:hypothetical protein